MSEEKWTRGPWERRNGVQRDAIYIEGPEADTRWLIAEVGGRANGMNNANANLIAKAPEMYAQLNRVRGTIKCFWSGAIRDELLAEIEALLASARGEA